MSSANHAVWVTGLGMISSRGEGINCHAFPHLSQGMPDLDVVTYAPFSVHPMKPLNLDTYIPKKLDQRQMEPWQRFGVYCAGMALQDSGLEGGQRNTIDLLVAAGGGERDCAVDEAILCDLLSGKSHEEALNQRLMCDLRPTLFLAQLSNLLAGNIALVHGVTGASRTLLGEEQAGVDVVRSAWAQIRSGQSNCILVGASYNAERPDVLLTHALNGRLWAKEFCSVWERTTEESGFILGSGSAFLVLESEEHGRRRGVRPQAILSEVWSDLGFVDDALSSFWGSAVQMYGRPDFITSGATGLKNPTEKEALFLARHASGIPVYTTGDVVGHLVEAHFLASIVLSIATLKSTISQQAFITSINQGSNTKGECAVGFASVVGVA
jgi:3-oxoacyl-[acyl-carrier-protein] synthase II